MDRSCLSDTQWNKIAHLLPGKPGDPGRSGVDNRLFVEAVLWIARTGAPWRDLPASFGNWNPVFQRFRRWARKNGCLQVASFAGATKSENPRDVRAPNRRSEETRYRQIGRESPARSHSIQRHP